MGDYQNENKTASLLSSILAALGGGTSDGGAFIPGSTPFTLVGGEVDDTSTATLAEDHAGAARLTPYRALHVNLRDNAGNEVTLSGGSGGGGTQYTEDAAAVANPVGTVLNLIRADGRPGTLTDTDGDNVSARGTNNGELYVKHVDAIPVTDNSGSLTVDGTVGISGTVAATQSGTWNIGTLSTVTNVVHVDDNAGSLTVDGTVAATQSGTWNVATVTTVTGITNVVHVDDNSGSLTVDQATASNLKVEPAGNVAHDGVDSGNPLKVGGRAKSTLTGVTLVSADDRADVMTDLDGVLLARPQVPLGNLIQEVKTDTGGTSTAFSTFGAAANLRNYITAVTISNSSASTFCTMDLRDGTGGSVIWTFPVPASGGVTMNFDPPLRQPTVNTALAMDPSAAVSTITVSVNGFQSKA